MPLEEYRRKRDFARTPEPSGAEPAVAVEPPTGSLPSAARGFPGWDRLPAGHRFCVQMHHASRLHWDLRLELDGVLLSWAVPKGPTLDPHERRLAVHVEDHPLEYGDFEGVIPSGYGAGTVELWDAGTVHWIKESEADPAGSLARGDLKFTLDGVKLRGEFALVRTGGRRRGAAPDADADKQWLLIKKRDDHAVDGMQAVALDVSVRSGRTLAEIAAAGAEGSPPASVAEVIAAAPERRVAGTLEPMLATPLTQPFSREGWLFELKYDGVRAIATLHDGEVRVRGRSGRDETRRYPELHELADRLRAHDAIVDGEIVAFDAEGNPSFERLQRRINLGDHRQVERVRAEVPAVLVVFDLISADGHDLRDLPLRERKRLLRALLSDGAAVRYADHVEAEGESLFAAIAQRGLEGMVAKDASSRYQAGRRSPSWLKVRAWRTQDCVVCGVTAVRGGGGDIGALVLGVYDDDGRLVHCGRAGSGLDGATIRQIEDRIAPLLTDVCPFDEVPPTETPVRWVRPELVCSVRHIGWTNAGTLRQPSFRGLRDDLRPTDCVRERELSPQVVLDQDALSEDRAVTQAPRPSAGRTGDQTAPFTGEEHAAELEALAEIRREGRWEIAGRRLPLTNLDKELWPGEGITKRDMIAYYVRLAPLLLPHLRDRPVGMQVFPDGIEGKHFWRKRIPDHAPEWIRAWTYRGDKTVTYVLVDEVATLAWMANAAVIDIHPWHSRIDAPDQPDWAVFDLDPFPPASFDDVRDVARLVHAALDHYSLRGLPKVSGQTGLQIYVPIDRGPDQAAVRAWVEEVARAIGQVRPELITWDWEVARRTGRIRIDYTQNVVGKTLAAPYSLRPAPGAPVSTAITWEELDAPGLRPDGWTMHTILDRVVGTGDLFAPVLSGGQRLDPLLTP